MKVIVVSSGSSVLKHEAGATIDGFDVIIRCNRAFIHHTKEYWRNAGSRTDWLALNPANMGTPDWRKNIVEHESYSSLKGILAVSFDRKLNPWSNPKLWEGVFPDKEHEFTNPTLAEDAYYGTGLFRSTCGVLATLHAAQKYGEVWVYGFRPERGCNHYYTDPVNPFFTLTAPGVGNFRWLQVEEEFLRTYNNIHFLEDELK